MENWRRKPKSHYVEPPKHLALVRNFDFVFPISMQKYEDQLQAECEKDNLHLSADSGGLNVYLCTTYIRSERVWLMGKITAIDANSVTVAGKTGISSREIFIYVFMAICVVVAVGFGFLNYLNTRDNFAVGWFIPILGYFIFVYLFWVHRTRTYLLNLVQKAGTGSKDGA